MKKLLQIYSFGARGIPEFPVDIFPLPQLPKNNHVSELQQLILCAVSRTNRPRAFPFLLMLYSFINSSWTGSVLCICVLILTEKFHIIRFGD